MQSISTERKYNYSLLYWKFIMCFFVVGIHSFPVRKINSEVVYFVFQGIARLAVPCFFAISAYLYFYRNPDGGKYISFKKYCMRLIKLMVGWTIVTLPYILYVHVYIPLRTSENVWKGILNIIIRNVLSIQFNGFWYIYACILCAVLFYCCCKNQKAKKFLLALAAWGQIVAILSANYRFLLPQGLSNYIQQINQEILCLYNSVFVGLSYFWMGYYFANVKSENRWMHKWRYLGMLISLLLLFCEIHLMYILGEGQPTDCYIMLLPVTYFMMLTFIDINTPITKKTDFLSAFITVNYVTQFSSIFYLQVVQKTLEYEFLTPATMYILIILLSCCITLAIIYFKNRMKWLINLY